MKSSSSCCAGDDRHVCRSISSVTRRYLLYERGALWPCCFAIGYWLAARKLGHFPHATRLPKMALAVKNRDYKCVRETVAHQRRNRRTQSCFIVVNAVALSHEIDELRLLIEKQVKRRVNARKIRRPKYFRRRK